MTWTPRFRRAVRTVLCYMLCGPPIGGFVAVAYLVAIDFGPHRSHSFSDYVFISLAAIFFGYIFGFLPALATGIIVGGVVQNLGHWGRNVFVHGLIGATMSAASVLANSSYYGGIPNRSTYLFFSLPGLIAAFCCSRINRHFEPKFESIDRAAGSSVGAT